jgi:hypothetical protein
MVKKRTLNEYRQVKDSVYKQPKVKQHQEDDSSNLDALIEMVKKYPNDWELGRKVREFYVTNIKEGRTLN